MSSSRSMEENGWNLENISTEDRLVLSKRGCWNLLHTIDELKWMKQKWSNSTITTSFWNDGKASLEFDNCNNEGRVTVLLDGKEIGHSTPNKESTTVAFNVAEGSVLSIKTDSSSIIRLVDMKLECGETIIYQCDI